MTRLRRIRFAALDRAGARMLYIEGGRAVALERVAGDGAVSTSEILDWVAVFGYLGVTFFVMWRVLIAQK